MSALLVARPVSGVLASGAGQQQCSVVSTVIKLCLVWPSSGCVHLFSLSESRIKILTTSTDKCDTSQGSVYLWVVCIDYKECVCAMLRFQAGQYLLVSLCRLQLCFRTTARVNIYQCIVLLALTARPCISQHCLMSKLEVLLRRLSQRRPVPERLAAAVSKLASRQEYMSHPC